MADTLLASVSGLSAALIVAAARTRSLWLASAGWIASAFSLLIKPAGILIMAAVAGIFVVEVIARACAAAPAGNHPGEKEPGTITFAGVALAICAVVFSMVLWISFHSPYLGKETRELFSAALSVSRQLYPFAPFGQFLQFARTVVGWPIAFLLLTAAVLMSVRFFSEKRTEWRRGFLIPLSGILILFTASLCWWWLGPGAISRYYFPFVTLLIIWAFSNVFEQHLVSAQTRILRSARVALFFPPILLAFLLLSKGPPIPAQRALGVNLSAGLRSEELKAGLFLIDAAERAGKPFDLYTLDGFVTEFPHFQDFIQWVHSKPRGMLLWPVRANQWTGDPRVRTKRILECDYILFEGDFPDPKTPLRRIVASYRDEIHEFARFANGLGSGQGVTLRRFGRLTVVELRGRILFEKAFWTWAQTIDWRTTFVRRNPMGD